MSDQGAPSLFEAQGSIFVLASSREDAHDMIHSWIADHPEFQGSVLSLTEAEEVDGDA